MVSVLDRWRALSLRRRLVFAGVAVVLVAAVGTGLAVSEDPAPQSGRPGQDALGPVLLVPGYGGSRDALERLAAAIRDTGRQADVLTLAGDGTGDLRQQAGVLADAVQRAYAQGAPSVDVIGYSAGGVVARLWVADRGGEHQARRVVTLGAPMHGTTVASAGGALVPGACPVACQQLTPGSALLRQLPPLPPGLPWLSVWTQDDQTVVPPDSARLEGAVNVPLQQVCPGNHAAHGDLPTDPATTALVLRALGTAPLAAPASCP